MNLADLFVFLVILIFGTFLIQENMKNNKIHEKVLLLFLFIISFIIFIFRTPYLLFSDIFTLILIILFIFYLYKKNYLNDLKSKILVSLLFLLITINGYLTIVNYLINLVIFYILIIEFMSILKTSIKNKKQVLKNIDYKKQIFQVSLVFILSSIIFSSLPKSLNKNITTLILFATIIFLFLIVSKSKNFFDKFDDDFKIILNVVLFGLLVLFFHEVFLKYFFPILFLKIFIQYSSKIPSKISYKTFQKQLYFIICLFLVALLTILFSDSIIVIFVKFIM